MCTTIIAYTCTLLHMYVCSQIYSLRKQSRYHTNCRSTVVLKGMLTVLTQSSRLKVQWSRISRQTDQISSFEYRVSGIDKQGVLKYENSKRISRNQFTSQGKNSSHFHAMYRYFASTLDRSTRIAITWREITFMYN